MADLLGLVVGLAFVGLAARSLAGSAMWAGRRRARVGAWRQAAAAVGLTDVAVRADAFVRALDARAGDLAVRLESVPDGTSEERTRLVVRPVVPREAGLTVRRASEATSYRERTGGWRDVAIGDPAFDDVCFVVGPGHLALALLDAETRRLLADQIGRQGVSARWSSGPGAPLTCGVLQLWVRNSWRETSGRFQVFIREGLTLARRLTPPSDLPLRLAENLSHEPQPDVRVNLLRTLAVDFPKHPATRPALRAATEDCADAVRLHAALELGEEGHEALRALVVDGAVADACSARAIAGLGAGVSSDCLRDVLARALGSDRVQTAVACLEALGRRHDATAEREMRDALGSPVEAEQLAAAAALGRAGTVSAVEDLLAVEAHAHGRLRAAARQAIDAIQARLVGAAAGQLALATAGGGTLSLADDGVGRVSIASEDGRLDEPGTARSRREWE